MGRKKAGINAPVPVEGTVYLEDATLPEVIAMFTEFSEKHGCPIDTITIEVDHWDQYVMLKGLRPPTENEIAKRRAASERATLRAQKAREAKEARERAEFERLAKKYGSTSR